MTNRAARILRGMAIAGAVLTASGLLFAEASGNADEAPPVLEVSPPVTPFVFEGDVRDLPEPPQWLPGDPVKEIPRRFYPPPETEGQYADPPGPFVDLLHDKQLHAPDHTSSAFTDPTRSFPGQGYTGVNPPDTVGDVGPEHYIQMINSSGGTLVRIYDKAEPVPNTLATFSLDSLGSGSCASGYGDPIALWDALAGRWLLSEFSSSGNRLCVYISQTADPVAGGWFNYAYQAPSFPDYPKYGVWPTDANDGLGSYIVTANDGGPGVYALDRGAMLTGAPGTYQRLPISNLPGFAFEAPTPADLDGTDPPPATAPAIIMRHRDTEVHNGPSAPGDVLEMWAFSVDWIQPSSTTIVQLTNIDVVDFDSSLCGLTSFFCFPQPGTGTTLDPLREVIMNRLQYRNQGNYEVLVGNFVVDTNGANHGGIRWFELRRSGAGGWSLHQEGTYSIDGDHRWMAASAMDQSGNIAMAYNVSSSSTFPSLRYTGRMAGDPAGVMTQAESNIHAGTASNSSNRYGDYAAMNVDPADDCTFWFTSLDNTSSNWRTQIASFRFDACGCELAPVAPVAAAESAGDNRIDVSWDDSSLPSVAAYHVRRSFLAGGPYDTVATVEDTSPGTANGAGYTYEDIGVSGGTTYYYTIESTDGEACTSDPSHEVNATATGACTLQPGFDGLQIASTPYAEICTIDLEWEAGQANCDGPLVYNVYRSTTSGFVPDGNTLLVEDYPTTSFSDLGGLVTDTPYYYVVRARDVSADVEDDNLVESSATPRGTLTSGTWSDDAGDTSPSQMFMETPWSIDPDDGMGGSAAYKTGSYANNLCSGLRTPPLQLGGGSVLTFRSHYAIETSWDKGEVQVSTDGGAVWQRVELNYPGTSTHTADECDLPTGSYFTGTGSAYAEYTADLSAWSGQVVELRWALSTDTSQNGAGWWIDDIDITQVDVPSECTTGSACEENPFVNVTPDGPLMLCQGEPLSLTATLAGGQAPFLFRWLGDGVEIPGADAATYEANEFGTHGYNARVRSEMCEDESTDGSQTQVTWVDAPLFDGIAQASDAGSYLCAVDLSWDAAATVCPGPVSYSIYRDTDSPVAVEPEQLVAAGISGTTFSDAVGLAYGATYHYVVRAVEGSTGEDDGNSVEAAAAPTGISGGSCVTGQAPPPEVPDGRGGTTPLIGARASLAGDAIDLNWDAGSCPASGYNLLFGNLENVSSYSLAGGRCGLGTSGSYAWTGVPQSNLFFLVVGRNGMGIESSWGRDSEGLERNGDAASGACLIWQKNTAATCP